MIGDMNTKYSKYLSVFVVLVAFLLFKSQKILATNTTIESEDNIYQAECTLKKLDYIGTAKIIRIDSGIVSVYFTLQTELNRINSAQELQIKNIVKKSLNLNIGELTLKCVTGSPSVTQLNEPDWVDEKLYDVAYLDIDAATPEEKLEILEARNIIIKSSEWVPDGCDGWVENVETGEIIQRVPTFHELFPHEWDVPIFNELDFKTRPEIPIVTSD